MEKGEGAYTGEHQEKDGMEDKREHDPEHAHKRIQEQEKNNKTQQEPEQSRFIVEALAESWYLT
jgi:hypothetical protein